MNNKWIRIILNGILVILIQVIFVDKINFWGTFNPKIFPIFLILFPKTLKPASFMTIGFVYGFILDMLSGVYGFGMASCTIICFLRPYLFKMISSKREDMDQEFISKLKDSNFIFRFVALTLLLFHLIYFMLEIGEFYNPFYIIIKSILSAFLAFVFYLLYWVIFRQTKKKNISSYKRVK